MSEAAGEAKNTTAPATSIGSPMRCSAAILSSTSARFCGTERYSSVPGVRMNVGATALTVIPCFPHSTARHFVRWAMAALVMQYTDSPGNAAQGLQFPGPVRPPMQHLEPRVLHPLPHAPGPAKLRAPAREPLRSPVPLAPANQIVESHSCAEII